MTLTLEIPLELQRELAREAAVRGVAVPVLAARLLKEAVARPVAADSYLVDSNKGLVFRVASQFVSVRQNTVPFRFS